MKLNIAAALYASAVNCTGKDGGSGLFLEEEQRVASLYLCICICEFVHVQVLLSRRGSGVWRPLAISTGSQARPWRGGETPGRSGGLDRTLELSIRGVIPDQNG